jgi:hypothetical protein
MTFEARPELVQVKWVRNWQGSKIVQHNSYGPHRVHSALSGFHAGLADQSQAVACRTTTCTGSGNAVSRIGLTSWAVPEKKRRRPSASVEALCGGVQDAELRVGGG